MKRLLWAIGISGSLVAQVTAPNSSAVTEWTNYYHVDASLDQRYANMIASFITYLMAHKPSERFFKEEFTTVQQTFPQCPNEVQRCLIKTFHNAYISCFKHRSKPNSRCFWQRELMAYYNQVYKLLDESHKTIGYGKDEGKPLPKPLPLKA